MCSEFLKEFSIDDQSKMPQLVGILEIQLQELLILLKIYHLFMIFPMMVNIHYSIGKV
jgi:ACR3 family arsenite efflux pump ArsB